ncbi:MAG: DNA translocase FtsK [Bacillota bacterium]|nr:DNA translocase FtsK [Bacillota bacterium]
MQRPAGSARSPRKARPARRARPALPEPLRRELAAVVVAALAALLGGALAGAPMGPAGRGTRAALVALFGVVAWAAPVVLAAVAVALLRAAPPPGGRSRAVGATLIVADLAGWASFLEPAGWAEAVRGRAGGGLLGTAVWSGLSAALGRFGGAVLLAAVGLAGLLLLTGSPLSTWLGRAWGPLRAFFVELKGALEDFLFEEEEEAPPAPGSDTRPAQPPRSPEGGGPPEAAAPGRAAAAGTAGPAAPEPAAGGEPAAGPFAAGEAAGGAVAAGGAEGLPGRPEAFEPPIPPRMPMSAPPEESPAGGAGAAGGPGSRAAGGRRRERGRDEAGIQLPPLDLLNRPAPARIAADREEDLRQEAALLEATLRSFGVETTLAGVYRGPAVTRFELQPAPGVKVARIVALADDIALALAAPEVRVVAPVPGKSVLGIEVPNKHVTPVTLREVLESPAFQNSRSRLTVAIGKDIGGRPIVATLDDMLHVLIAGATGSGKSVCINTLITSLLFKARPRDVRLLLIDPKRVELSGYEGLPHLLAPVITDPKKSAGAMRWLVREMERRYELFAEWRVRDIDRFNQAVLRDGSPALPYIVVVVDELADLMMVAPREIEESIQRLAQMARAAGIHLVLATQRPSVDVITGVIKANIPSRIAFAVSSQVDSRTILDMAGAEKLLGKGDMLFYPLGAAKPVRAQGAYVSERELERVLTFLRDQAGPEYVLEVGASLDDDEEAGDDEDDPLLPEAIRVVVENRQASVSILQRRLRVGYTRAGRLIDMMERRGIVGPYQGPKPREVLMTPETYARLYGFGARPDEAGGGPFAGPPSSSPGKG